MSLNAYVCPKCKGSLEHQRNVPTQTWPSSGVYICHSCALNFPVIAGIADFRLYADPYIDIDADRAKGLLLAQKAQDMTFAQLVAFYYSITPEVPFDLAKYYLNHHLAGTVRGAGLLERMQASGMSRPATESLVLDLGCGTGGFAAAAGDTGARVIGVDIAFRWLVVAGKRLQESGINNVNLVCACADYLPFLDNSFDLVVAENLIEHVQNQIGLFSEIGRVRKTRSSFYARTVNRYAIGPEPHVGVWGVGLLPRRWQNSFVKTFKGIPYEHIYLQSFKELKASIAKSAQRDLRVRAARLVACDYQHHPSIKRKLFELYKVAAESRSLTTVVTHLGPYLDIVSEAPKAERLQDSGIAITLVN